MAILAGCRTPFARAGTVYRDLTAVDLAKACVRELVERTEIDPASVETVAMGQVIPSVKAPNLAREVVLGTGLPGRHPRAHREPRLRVRERGDRRGRARRSGPGSCEVGHRRRCREPVRRAHPAQQADGAGARGGVAGPLPRRPAARLRRVPPARPRPGRARHRRAVDGPDHGAVGGEDGEGERHHAARSRTASRCAAIGTRPPPSTTAACRPRCARCAAARVRPARSTPTTCCAGTPRWRRSRRCRPCSTGKYGTVTAGNSSPLTDGAAAVLLMSEERARGRGLRAARVHPLVGDRGRRPGRTAPDGPGARHPAGARPRRPRRSRTWT